jgi:carboxypeptidase C (cathepsin A)
MDFREIFHSHLSLARFSVRAHALLDLGVEYSINHMGLDAELKKNIIMKYYEAGHMMYTHQPSMEKFKEDVDAFIDETAK